MEQTTSKSVGIKKQRKYTLDIGKLTLRRALMSKQAKVLTQQEIRRVLDYVATRPHSVRNRAMFLTMLYAMLRVKECAALRYADVLDSEGKIKAEFYLSAEQTKGHWEKQGPECVCGDVSPGRSTAQTLCWAHRTRKASPRCGCVCVGPGCPTS